MTKKSLGGGKSHLGVCRHEKRPFTWGEVETLCMKQFENLWIYNFVKINFNYFGGKSRAFIDC